MYQKKFVNYWSSKINDSSGDSKQLYAFQAFVVDTEVYCHNSLA